MNSKLRHGSCLWLPLALILASPVVPAAEEIRQEFHEVHPLKSEGKIELINVNGNVHVKTWDRDEISVDAVKHANKQQAIDEATIKIDAQADGIRIETKYPDKKKQNSPNAASVDYTLTVPGNCHLKGISTVNGDIKIEKVSGNIKAASVNGTLTASGLAGSADLSTVNGSVNAAFIEVKRNVTLKSVNGRITVALPGESNAEISANTLQGGISSGFPLKVQKHFPVGENLKDTLGRGGPKIEMSTVNGGIRIEPS